MEDWFIRMDMDKYQKNAASTAVYPKEVAMEYLLLQLASEAGEAAGKLGKALRKGLAVNPEALALELGDVLWYVANAAREIGYDLSEVAAMNLGKLQSRQERGVIHGDGDNR